MANIMFPNLNQHNTKAGAFRHPYFSLLNVKALGLALTTSLGNAHEENTNQSIKHELQPKIIVDILYRNAAELYNKTNRKI